MRNVRYGRFVDFMPPSYDYDSGMIGGHIYTRNAEEASLKTAGYEYYVTKDGVKVTIYDASLLEKMAARVRFAFNTKKKRVLGVRTEKKDSISPYSDPVPQLGVRLDENGNKVVDEDYYRNAEERAIARGDRKAAREVYEKKQEVEAELAAMFEEEQKEVEEAKGYHK
jgi:hypothetical protein